jgi:ABC-2 type transport system ATP-binding protein
MPLWLGAIFLVVFLAWINQERTLTDSNGGSSLRALSAFSETIPPRSPEVKREGNFLPGSRVSSWWKVEPRSGVRSIELIVEKVSKTYHGNVHALSNFGLKLGPGVLGLLGPNGAGKSTLIRILATVTRPSAGRVLWNGTDATLEPDSLRTVLGYLPQNFGVYRNLSAIEFLEYLAAVKGLGAASAKRRIGELLELVNLTGVARRPLDGFSGGMLQRIGIAQALLNDPQVLIVDEPTAGLDPEERLRFRNLLSELSGERIVILSTHIVSDVEAVATDIALIAQGQLVAHATPEVLIASVDKSVWEVTIPNAELAELRATCLVSNIAHRADGVHARVIADSPPRAAARPLEPSLEDAYLAVLGARRSNKGLHGAAV